MSNELKKGDIVKFEGQLSVVEEYSQGKTTLLIFILAAKTSLVVRVDEVIKATRTDVEAYLKGKGWELEEGNYVQLGNMYIIPPPLNGYYGFALEFTAYESYFHNAPAMQAEAITMAKLLNATKD